MPWKSPRALARAGPGFGDAMPETAKRHSRTKAAQRAETVEQILDREVLFSGNWLYGVTSDRRMTALEC